MPSVVVPDANRTRLTPKSSPEVAVSVIVCPGEAVAGADSEIVGGASLTGIGALSTGHCPVLWLPWLPFRYGKKSTELDVDPPCAGSGVGTPVTWFSPAGGFVVGAIVGAELVVAMS